MSERQLQMKFLLKFTLKRFAQRGTWSRVIVMGVFLGIVAGMWSLNREVTDGPQRYLKSLSVDYWVMQHGTSSLATSSYVKPTLLDELNQAGYQAEGTLIYFNRIDKIDGVYQSYKPGGILDPTLASGRQVRTAHEVVLDHLLARDLGKHVGSYVDMVGRRYKVVGLSRETNSIGKQAAFINQAAMTAIVGQPTYQVLAVRLKPGQAWPPPGISLAGYDSMGQQQFIASNLNYWVTNFSLLFYFMVLLAIAGLLVAMYFSLKQAFNQQKRQLAMMRAVGSSRRFIVEGEAIQAAICLAVSLIIGGLAAYGLTQLFDAESHGVSAGLSAQDVGLALACGLVATIVAEAVPLMRLMRLSPMEALRD